MIRILLKHKYFHEIHSHTQDYAAHWYFRYLNLALLTNSARQCIPESAFLQTNHAPEIIVPWTEMGFERLILVNQPTSSANSGLSVSAEIFY